MWNDSVPAQIYPQLMSFTKRIEISIQKAQEIVDIQQLFHLQISSQALDQLLQLAASLERLTLTSNS
ncbi:hypothetical protein Q6247_25585, partial [Klebsiella pneumoniae]